MDNEDYYPLSTGDLRLYRNMGGTQDRMRVAGAVVGEPGVWRIVTTQGGTFESFYRRNSAGIFLLGSRDNDPVARAIGDFEVFRLPVRTGQSWLMYDTLLRGLVDVDGDGRNDDVSVRATALTVGYEAVDTPVGRFDRALKLRIESVQTAILAGSGRQVSDTVVTETWYVAGLGPVRSTVRQLGPPVIERASNDLAGYRVGTRRSETTPPEWVFQSPAPNSAVQSAVVQLTFNEEMDPDSAAAAPVVVTGPDGQVLQGNTSWDSLNRTVTFTPAAGPHQGTHQIRVSPFLTDLLGNPLSKELSWAAVMDNVPPAVLSVTPTPDATGVSIRSFISVTLSEPVLPANMLGGGVQVFLEGRDVPIEGTITGSGAQWTFTPAEPLWRNKRYRVLVSSWNIDLSVNALPGTQSVFDTETGRLSPLTLPLAVADPRDTVVADLDGIGRPELVYFTRDNRVLALQAAAAGGVDTRELLADVPFLASQLVVDDIDADGRTDLLLHPGPTWLRQNPDGRFIMQPLPGPGGATDVLVLRQANGLRALLGSAGSRRLIWRQTSAGVFADPQDITLSGSCGVDCLAADMDGDGLADVVSLLGFASDRFAVCIDYQDADGQFRRNQVLPAVTTSAAMRLAVADLDGDGLADIVFTTPETGIRATVWWARQLARGNFASPAVITSGALNHPVAVDFNGDGKMDVITSSNSGTVSLHLQLPDGRFAAAEDYTESLAYGPLTLADFDGDGKMDLGSGAVLWRQTGASTPARAPAGSLRFGILKSQPVQARNP